MKSKKLLFHEFKSKFLPFMQDINMNLGVFDCFIHNARYDYQKMENYVKRLTSVILTIAEFRQSSPLWALLIDRLNVDVVV